jgi:hypothetical protein
MSYVADAAKQFRRAAGLVDRLAAESRPATLIPVSVAGAGG